MTLLASLPSPDRLTGILSPVLGDPAAGTGVAGVLKLLESVDAPGLSKSLGAQLGSASAASFSIDAGSLTGGAAAGFQQAVSAFPSDPAELIKPLTDKLATLKNLSSADLSSQLQGGLKGLGNLGDLVPANAGELVAGAAAGLTRLTGELTSGGFGEIRRWSQAVGELQSELEPLLAGGAGSVEERLLGFLRQKIGDLTQTLVPGQPAATALAGALDAVIDGDRLAAIADAKGRLIAAMNLARAELDQGNLTNTTHLAAAEGHFRQLTSDLGAVADRLGSALGGETATAEGLGRALERRCRELSELEVVDLGNLKDKLKAAIGGVEEAVRGVDLGAVRQTVEGVFQRLDEVIGQFDLGRLTAGLSDLQAQLQPLLAGLDATLLEITAAVRNLFQQIREALAAVAASLGTYDAEGKFRFHVQQDIEGFLNGIKTTLRQTIQPTLDQFKSTVGVTLRQVQAALDAVQGEIDKVKAELQGALQGVGDQLRSLDVPGQMEKIRQELEGMLSSLGELDFDPVVDPVVAQIDEMAGGLKKIDVSSLGDFARGALKVSVEVVVGVDFTAQISDVLLAEIDQLLEIPRGALGEVEERLEGVLERFGELEPGALLAPLDTVFEPVTAQIDGLGLEALLAPLDAWHGEIEAELEKVSPASLLKPLLEVFTEMQQAFDAISPAALVRPLEQAIDEVKGAIREVDVTALAGDLTAAIERVKGQLDRVSPAALLDPLVGAFDKIVQALDRFEPQALLAPLTSVTGALTAPLDNLSADHLRVISEVFAGLRAAVEGFDPQRVFRAVGEKAAAVEGRLRQLDVGALMAELRTPHSALAASLAAHTGSGASLTASVEGLNPLRDETFGRVSADLQRRRPQLAALAGAEPPAAAVSCYQEVQPKLESLIPSWAAGEITGPALRRAFAVIDPAALGTEIGELWEAVKTQLRSFDPRAVREGLRSSFDKVESTVLALDPQAALNEVQAAVDAVTSRLDQVDLRLVTDELEEVAGEVRTLLAALDPQPIIDQLSALVDEVTGVVGELKPSEFLKELGAPLEQAKDTVAEFSPAIFKQPLEEVFGEIEKILADVDVGVVLKPLTDRLDRLRDELEQGLDRTGTAFDGMLRAIPV